MLTRVTDSRRNEARDRHYGLDWLRVGAFILLIFHHIGMVFVPGTWLVKVPDPVQAAEWPMVVIQPWRMPLLFAVSGYASFRLIRRSVGLPAFLRTRSLRLLLPILFGIAFVTPPEIWVAVTQSHHYGESFWHFWVQDWFRFGSLDGMTLPNLAHLWFLGYLWTYTACLTLVLILSRGKLDFWLERLCASLAKGSRLVWVPLALLLPLRLSLLFTVPEQSGLFHDWVSDVTFVPAFLLGYALAAHPSYWDRIAATVPQAGVVAAAASALLLGIEYAYPVHHSHIVQAVDRAAQLALAWTMILLLLAAANRYANYDHPIRRRLNEAVFPLYIAHQTIIVVAAWWLLRYSLNYWLLASCLVAITFAGSWLFYEFARRAGVMRPWLGLSPPDRRSGIRDRSIPALAGG